MAIPLWIKERLLQKPNLERALRAFSPSGKADGKLLFAEHHQSHAASAFFPDRTCDALEAGNVVGWFQGRMEFGPRALGNRSILGDPRNPEMQQTLNLKVKYRESFRPFAPSVLREKVADYFELDADSPYMLLVADVKCNRRRPMTVQQQRLFGIDKLQHRTLRRSSRDAR